MLIALASLTHWQAHHWTSDLALWQHAVFVTPDKPRPWINYGVALDRAGETAAAALAFDRAVVGALAVPRPPGVRAAAVGIASTNLALLRWRQGDVVRARVALRQALTAAPDFAPALVSREWICPADC